MNRKFKSIKEEFLVPVLIPLYPNTVQVFYLRWLRNKDVGELNNLLFLSLASITRYIY